MADQKTPLAGKDLALVGVIAALALIGLMVLGYGPFPGPPPEPALPRALPPPPEPAPGLPPSPEVAPAPEPVPALLPEPRPGMPQGSHKVMGGVGAHAKGPKPSVVPQATPAPVPPRAPARVPAPASVPAPIQRSPRPGLVSWWPADDENANDYADGNHGRLQNGVTFAPGKVGLGFMLDGVSGFVRIPHAPNLNPETSLSINAWIYLETDGRFQIVTKWGDQGTWRNQRAYSLHTIPQRGLTFSIADREGQWNTRLHEFSSPPNVIGIRRWNHVAVVYDQPVGARRIFVNSVLVAEQTDPPIILTRSIADVGIGAALRDSSTSCEFFPGLIDEVQIHDRVLSGSEIRSIVNAGNR